MSATGADPEPTAEDQAYFAQVESAFLRLRGRATLLSAADWQTAAGWRRRGIPIGLVVQVMETLFARRAARKQRTISSLRYFSAAVEGAWEEVVELQAGGRLAPPAPLAIEDRLARLAAALPEGLADRTAWEARIARAAGELPEIEASLARWDGEILLELDRRLTQDERQQIEIAVAEALGRLRARWTDEEVSEAEAGIRRRLLRRHFGLPLLSLFAPEAEGRKDSPP